MNSENHEMFYRMVKVPGIRDQETLTLHLIKIVSEELLIIRLIPYLCCLKEEKADRKGNLFRGQQSFRVYEPS